MKKVKKKIKRLKSIIKVYEQDLDTMWKVNDEQKEEILRTKSNAFDLLTKY